MDANVINFPLLMIDDEEDFIVEYYDSIEKFTTMPNRSYGNGSDYLIGKKIYDSSGTIYKILSGIVLEKTKSYKYWGWKGFFTGMPDMALFDVAVERIGQLTFVEFKSMLSEFIKEYEIFESMIDTEEVMEEFEAATNFEDLMLVMNY